MTSRPGRLIGWAIPLALLLLGGCASMADLILLHDRLVSPLVGPALAPLRPSGDQASSRVDDHALVAAGPIDARSGM